MTQIDKLIAIEQAYIGTKESPANSNLVRFNDQYFGRKGVSAPWCATSQFCAFEEAGLLSLLWGDKPKARAAVAEGVKNWKSLAIKLGRWYTSGFKRGDVVIFDFSGKRIATEHIGYIESAGTSISSITTLEGNTGSGSNSNGGEFLRRTREVKYVTGVFRPNYSEQISTVKDESATASGAVLPTIRKGDKGETVKMLQTALNKFGYKLSVDGDFGALTDAAARNFQKSFGLAVDGIVGKNTWGKLGVR
jgi:hypothetical protein